jgi:hypothetical protein
MEKMGKMTRDEEFAYLKARNIYLETIHEIKKKTLLEFLEKSVSSTKPGK